MDPLHYLLNPSEVEDESKSTTEAVKSKGHIVTEIFSNFLSRYFHAHFYADFTMRKTSFE